MFTWPSLYDEIYNMLIKRESCYLLAAYTIWTVCNELI